MRLTRTYAENAYTFRNLDIDFSKYSGVSCIVGWNHSKGSPNGSGKSSLNKIQYYALTGKEIKGEPLDEIINRRHVSEGMFVMQEFEESGRIYRIMRYRKYKPKKDNQGRYLIAGEPVLDPGIEIPKGTGAQLWIDGVQWGGKRDGQSADEAIEAKIGMTPRLLLSTMIIAQNSERDFLTSPDSEKKDIIADALDTAVYKEAHKLIAKEEDVLEQKISEIESKLESIAIKLEEKRSELSSLTSAMNEHQGKKEAVKLTKLNRLNQLTSELDQLKGKSSKRDISEMQSRLSSLTEAHAALIGQQEAFEVVSEVESKARKKCDRLLPKIEQVSRDAEGFYEKLVIGQAKLKQLKEKTSGYKDKSQEALSSLQKLDLLISALSQEIEAEPLMITEKEKLLVSVSEYGTRLAILDSELKEIMTSDNCPKCEHKLTKDHKKHISSVIASGKNGVLEIKNKLNEAQKRLSEVESSLREISSKREELNQARISVRDNEIAIAQESAGLLEHESNLLKIAELENEIGLLKKKGVDSTDEAILLSHEYNEASVMQSEALAVLKQIEQSRKDSVSVYDKMRVLREEIAEAEVHNKKVEVIDELLADKTSQIDSLKAEINSDELAANPFEPLAKSAAHAISDLESRIQPLKKNLATQESELSHIRFWKYGFSGSGIRSFICDEAIGILNEQLRLNLDGLFCGSLNAVIRPVSTNSKGVQTNDIRVEYYVDGLKSPQGNLSGGEFRRVQVASNIALSSVAEMRLGGKLSVLWLDESLDGIDHKGGQLECFKLFNKISKNKSVFIVSHDESLQNLCSQTIYVLNLDGDSRIVSREEFMRYASNQR